MVMGKDERMEDELVKMNENETDGIAGGAPGDGAGLPYFLLDT